MVDSSSAHVDTFCRANLPPESEWPDFLLDGPELAYPDRLNCATALLDETVNALGGDRPCLLAPGGDSWTYGELLSTSNRIANLLTDELGVVPGNRVLLRGPNAPWLVACWFGVLKAGGVVVATMPCFARGSWPTSTRSHGSTSPCVTTASSTTCAAAHPRRARPSPSAATEPMT